jgi:hypothetical protein
MFFSLSNLELIKKAMEFYLANTRTTKQEKLLSARQIINALESFDSIVKTQTSTGKNNLLKPSDIRQDVSFICLLINHPRFSDGNYYRLLASGKFN